MALRELVASFDIRVGGLNQLTTLNRGLEQSKAGLLGNIGMFSTLGTAIASAFAVRKISDFFKSQTELGEELRANAAMLGINTDDLQKWQYATQMSGVSVGMFTRSLEHLQHSIGQLGIEQDKMLQQSFSKLGVQMKDAHGKSRALTDVLLDTADAFSKMNDQSERVAVARNIFGRAGAEILPLLQKGKQGIKELTDEAQRNGLILGTDWVEAAKNTAVEEHKLEWSWRAAKATIAQELFPTFRNFVDMVTKGVGWFKELAKHTTVVSSALTGLSVLTGIKLFGSMSKLLGLSKGGGFLSNLFGIGKLALIIAAIAVLYLAWDDLFALFTGKKSEIGDLIDQVYGKGQSTKDISDLQAAWKSVLDTIFGAGKATGDWSEIWGSFKSTLMTDLAVITHSIFSLVTLIARAGNFTVTLANQAGRAAGGKGFDTKKINDAFSEVKTAFHNADFSALGGALTPAITHNMATSGKGKIEINQHITVASGDPKKIGDAVHQRTAQALSQNDLRHAHAAVKNRAPVVSQ